MRPGESLLDELEWRGLLHQQSEGLAAHLTGRSVSAYAGFDPTASSFHVGNLVPIMGLLHLQRAGHRPVAVVGGGTGLIGDPSGKTTERQLLSAETIEENVQGMQKQLERFLDFTGARGAQMRNNADWLLELHAIDFMRDVGKHFTVNYMLAKESVKGRAEAGISYTEFSYMLLQAHDFEQLYLRDGVTLQVGGSDQWGNITAGIELIRRTHGAEAHAMTFPLITTAAGTKFGKSESGNVWLDAERTSPYQFYQFWINVDDRDVARYLRYFTLFGHEEIESLERAVAENPERRDAQRALAREVTDRVHGRHAARAAEDISLLLFGGGDTASLSEEALRALSREVPSAQIAEFPGAVDALVAVGLAPSRGGARRLIQQGGVSINGRRIAAVDEHPGDPLRGRYFLIRKGGREYALLHLHA